MGDLLTRARRSRGDSHRSSMYHGRTMDATSHRPGRRRNRRDDHTEATRQALLREGRKLFAARGFGGAGIEEIARRARVTTGALYHHFAHKRDLFQAVAEQVEQELMEQAMQAAARQASPWEMLVAGIDVMLDACAAPGVHRIAF